MLPLLYKRKKGKMTLYSENKELKEKVAKLEKDLAFFIKENYFNSQRLADFQNAYEIADRYYNTYIGVGRGEISVDDVNYEYKKEIDEVLPKFRQDVKTGEELTTREEMKVGRKDGSAIK